jgi:uncharacterized membrane protein
VSARVASRTESPHKHEAAGGSPELRHPASFVTLEDRISTTALRGQQPARRNMAFCAKCGAQVSGAFCPQCGAPAAGGPGPAAPGSGPSGPGSAGGSGLEDHVAAALCYALGPITGVIFLIWAPYNQSKNVRFHAFQSIFLSAAWFILNFMLGIVGIVLSGFGFYYLGRLVWLAGLALWVFMMYKTYNKQRVVLPLIGPLAEKQA